MTWARATLVAVMAAGALIAGGTAAVADPPKGWVPGDFGNEYDFGTVYWTHHGRYADAPGNWHTGTLTIEEDDDGITGGLYDWNCPAGAKPPRAGAPSTNTCTLARGRYLDSVFGGDPGFDLAQFDQAHNRLTSHRDVSVFDLNDVRLGTVRVDLTFQGIGKPTDSLFRTVTNGGVTSMDYFERYTGVVCGKVDGHRVRGPGTKQEAPDLGFNVSGWVRAK